MDKFLSCDWGVSSFRLRAVKVTGPKIMAEENSDCGIANSFELWRQSRKTEKHRLVFYLDIICQHIRMLEKKSGISLKGLPLIISGMASSTMGMMNLPYKGCPFFANGSDLEIKLIEADNEFFCKTIVVSGAKTNEDVIRGEETQLAGCFHDDDRKHVFVFPGTHSKHILVTKSKAVDFKTYMTGEFFELLSKKSILSLSIEDGLDFRHGKNVQSFKNGVTDSMKSNLLHNCFKVRTNDLFGKFTKRENYYYLSGLLIGTEMKELMNKDYTSITLVSDETLLPFYEMAFKVLYKKKLVLHIQNADEALISGQLKILKRLL
jgi:2-dehydro-3-deoxygalactonokinase